MMRIKQNESVEVLSKSNICQAGVALAGINSVILASDLIEDVTPSHPTGGETEAQRPSVHS